MTTKSKKTSKTAHTPEAQQEILEQLKQELQQAQPEAQPEAQQETRTMKPIRPELIIPAHLLASVTRTAPRPEVEQDRFTNERMFRPVFDKWRAERALLQDEIESFEERVRAKAKVTKKVKQPKVEQLKAEEPKAEQPKPEVQFSPGLLGGIYVAWMFATMVLYALIAGFMIGSGRSNKLMEMMNAVQASLNPKKEEPANEAEAGKTE